VSGTALSLRGTRYKNGGRDPGGFDCSGFVWYVFARHGLAVPRTVAEQYEAGGSVAATDLQAGDLVFFATAGSGASHVGIVVGGDSFVHAPSSSGVVRVERLGATYWASRFIGARRLL
jgi:cell wall-associated NlpC family hydrolase